MTAAIFFSEEYTLNQPVVIFIRTLDQFIFHIKNNTCQDFTLHPNTVHGLL